MDVKEVAGKIVFVILFLVAISIMWQLGQFSPCGSSIIGLGFARIHPGLSDCRITPQGNLNFSLTSLESMVTVNEVQVTGAYEETQYWVFKTSGKIECKTNTIVSLKPMEPSYVLITGCTPTGLPNDNTFEIKVYLNYTNLDTNTIQTESGTIIKNKC
jgi:hypothetical protein